MSAVLTPHWDEFIRRLIKSGRYNNRSEVIRAALRSLEELELERDLTEFEATFSGGRHGEPDERVIKRVVARQKTSRRA